MACSVVMKPNMATSCGRLGTQLLWKTEVQGPANLLMQGKRAVHKATAQGSLFCEEYLQGTSSLLCSGILFVYPQVSPALALLLAPACHPCYPCPTTNTSGGSPDQALLCAWLAPSPANGSRVPLLQEKSNAHAAVVPDQPSPGVLAVKVPTHRTCAAWPPLITAVACLASQLSDATAINRPMAPSPHSCAPQPSLTCALSAARAVPISRKQLVPCYPAGGRKPKYPRGCGRKPDNGQLPLFEFSRGVRKWASGLMALAKLLVK